MVLIELLISWISGWLDDVEGRGGEEKRPENWISDLAVTPNALAEIEFSRRRV